MAAQATTAHVTPKQLAASRANLKKARAAQAGKPRSSKQKSASRHNLVHARAARSARKHGAAFKPFVSVKRPRAAADIMMLSGSLARVPYRDPAGLPEAPALDSAEQWRETIHLPGRDSWLHALPVCAAVALAASLQWQSGVTASAAEVLELHRQAGIVSLAGLLEAAAEYGLAGRKLESFQRFDPGLVIPGLVYGTSLDIGYHAVLATAGGVMSWGLELPWFGEPAEAWLPVWEDLR